MKDVLKSIYEGESLLDLPFSDEYKQLCQEDARLWEKVKPLLDFALIDELCDSHARIVDQRSFEWFRRGFCIGASLMLELL